MAGKVDFYFTSTSGLFCAPGIELAGEGQGLLLEGLLPLSGGLVCVSGVGSDTWR